MGEGVEVTLDNVTFLGQPHSTWTAVEDELFGIRQEWPDRCRELPARALGASSAQVAWLLDGAHISCFVERSTLNHHWVTLRAEGQLPMRVEFNPNKVTGEVLWIVSRLMDIEKVSRADVALDYPGLEIAEWCFHRDRVKTAWHLGPNQGHPEGFYLGRTTSDRFVRVYDKAKEQKLDGVSLGRIEGVGRHRYVLHPGLFEGVDVLAPQVDSRLDPRDAAWVALALWLPAKLAQADPKTRRRVRDLARETCRRLSPDPNELYRDRHRDLLDQVEGLKHGVPSLVASVYRDKEAAPASGSSEGRGAPG